LNFNLNNNNEKNQDCKTGTVCAWEGVVVGGGRVYEED
jgi:hypothetical protein